MQVFALKMLVADFCDRETLENLEDTVLIQWACWTSQDEAPFALRIRRRRKESDILFSPVVEVAK